MNRPDCWIDVETGDWGLVSNLRLVSQEQLPLAVSAAATPNLDDKARRALIRCAGMDHGIRVSIPGGRSDEPG